MLPESKKLMKRAQRAANSVLGGAALLSRLKKDDARAMLIEGAEEETPSVSKVAHLVVETVGLQNARLSPVKTLVGLLVRAIMAEEGYVKSERGVRTDPNVDPDRLFTTGTVYAKAEVEFEEEEEDDSTEELVDLIVAITEKLLTTTARQQLVSRLEATID